jgi:hypothetical protein
MANVAFSQDFFDALRYSQTNYGGTARSISMGSAFGALGGDFSSASINPAGLGFYRSGEFTLSPTLNMNNSSANYLGTNSADNIYRFNFDNISYVGTVKTGVETGIVGVTFGFGFNRLKNFNQNRSVLGNNAQTSLLNYYTDYANSIGDPTKFDGLNEDLAWQTYLVDVDNDPDLLEGKYFNDIADYEAYDIYGNDGSYLGYGYDMTAVKKHTQRSKIESRGRIDEYLMSLGLNLNHKLYIGASVGLLDLEYRETTTFSEIDDNSLSDYFKDYTLRSVLSHSGVGVNFKTGVIFRPIKSLRLGLAFHTPNFYTIETNENKTITANYDQPVGDADNGYDTKWNYSANADSYQFKFETPLKVIASASYLLGSFGLVSVDYEWSNYSSSKLRHAGDNWDYSAQNTDIQNVFHSTGNLRIGGEFRATENFSLRAGYQLLGNPWAEKYSFTDGNNEVKTIDMANFTDSYSTYSAGFGYRQQNFFVDFAYRLTTINESFKVHEMSASNPSNGTNIAAANYLNNQATITFGFRF